MAAEDTSHNAVGNGLSVLSHIKHEELGNSTQNSNLKKTELVPAGEEGGEGKIYPPARKVAVVVLALYLSLFLVSLVRFPCFDPTQFYPHANASTS
jgi:hypothetical protein